MAETICEQIAAARGSAGLHCGFVALPSPSVLDVARVFGLCEEEQSYHEIARETAREVLWNILHHDLAYGVEIVDWQMAGKLAGAFLGEFAGCASRFYTNGNFHLPPDAPIEWSAVTGATFDTGVLIVGETRAGCLWVEDED